MDGDKDELSDDYEAEVASSGADATLLDGSADTDGDGMSNKDELAAPDPANVDSDNDGISDAVELANNMDPTDGSDASIDSDGDGMNDGEEISRGTNPASADGDGDGINDENNIGLGSIQWRYRWRWPIRWSGSI